MYRWGQVFILHALSKYTPDDSREAEAIAERVTPRLAHANSAVVLSTIRVRATIFQRPLSMRISPYLLSPRAQVLMRLLEYINSGEFIKNMCKKMTPPLGTALLLLVRSERAFFLY
jgi:hypothetical protein